jgi:hypothetical protein
MPIKCRKCGGAHFTHKCGKDKIYKILIKNMPIDIRVDNMKYMLQDWGDIGNIIINRDNYNRLSHVIIEFYNNEQANYFKEQINNTLCNSKKLYVSFN